MKYREGGETLRREVRRDLWSQIRLKGAGHANTLDFTPCLKGRHWGGF